MAFNFAARAGRYNVETVSAPPDDTKAIRAVVDGLLRQRVDAIVLVVVDVASSRWCAASTSASRSSSRRPRPGAAR